MIMDSMGRGEFLGGGKTNMVAREDRMEVEMHKRCINNMNGVELVYNFRMTFFEEFFHAMGNDDLRGAYGDALELIVVPPIGIAWVSL